MTTAVSLRSPRQKTSRIRTAECLDDSDFVMVACLDLRLEWRIQLDETNLLIQFLLSLVRYTRSCANKRIVANRSRPYLLRTILALPNPHLCSALCTARPKVGNVSKK
jgi:hypothetical protein